MRVVADQQGCPTAASDLADAIAKVAPRRNVEGRALRHLPCRWQRGHDLATALPKRFSRTFARAASPRRMPCRYRPPTIRRPPDARRTAAFRARASPMHSALRSAAIEEALPSVLDEALAAQRRPGRRHEGNRARRRQRDAPSSDHARGEQAAPADLRQADDLLSGLGADACRHPRHPRHHHARRPAAPPPPLRRRLATSACISATRRSLRPKGSRRRSSSAATSSATTALRLSSATTSFSATCCPIFSARRQRQSAARPSSPTKCAIPSATAS